MSGSARQRTTLAEARAARMERPAAAEAYEQASLRFELAETVRSRREELGLSQRQLAERAGMTQPGVARFEAVQQLICTRRRAWHASTPFLSARLR